MTIKRRLQIFAAASCATVLLLSAASAQDDADQKTRTIKASPGTPEIDGQIDKIWKSAKVGRTNRFVESESSIPAEKSATAKFRCLWDEKHLYVLAEVTDAVLGADGEDDWQQDSVEIFIDENLARSKTYDDDDGQFRINFQGAMSFGSTTKKAMKAAAKKTAKGYVIEAAIDLQTVTAKKGLKLGFDVQVNDDSDNSGVRSSIMKWNDATNESYQDVSGLGTLICSERTKPAASN